MSAEATHIIIRASNEFPAEMLGCFDGALIPIEKSRFVHLDSIDLHIDEIRYRTRPAISLGGSIKEVTDDGTHCIVHVVDPTPLSA